MLLLFFLPPIASLPYLEAVKDAYLFIISPLTRLESPPSPPTGVSLFVLIKVLVEVRPKHEKKNDQTYILFEIIEILCFR